jgi:hypothetical protein
VPRPSGFTHLDAVTSDGLSQSLPASSLGFPFPPEPLSVAAGADGNSDSKESVYVVTITFATPARAGASDSESVALQAAALAVIARLSRGTVSRIPAAAAVMPVALRLDSLIA